MAKTLAALLAETAQRKPNHPAMKAKINGQWVATTYSEYLEQAKALARFLIDSGIEVGDRVALLCETRREWIIADQGILHAAAVNVPIYPTLTAQQILYILRDSGARGIIVSTRDLYEKVATIFADVPDLRVVIRMEAAESSAASVPVTLWTDALEKGRQLKDKWGQEQENRVANVDPHQLASLIYTSGTTGEPKGVMLNHHNFLSNAEGVLKVVSYNEQDVALSFLPLSHVLERIAYYCGTKVGATVAFAESIESVAANLVEVRPTIMVSVPRLLEKVYAKVMDGVEAGSPLKKKIFKWAVKVGRAHRLGEGPKPARWQVALADKLVFSKLREKLGGNLRLMISGGAPLMKEIGEFFYVAGITVCEGYGLTETSPVLTICPPDAPRFGTVGKAIQGVSLKIAEDGEILAKGPNIMMGYYNKPEETRATIEPDGWLHTGDIGEIQDGYLKITDRKKELLVLSNGKNVAPQPIENMLKTSRWIEQAMVIGDNRKYCGALIVPAFQALEEWAAAKGISYRDRHDLLNNPAVQSLYRDEIQRFNDQLANYETIKKFELISREWTQDEDELTPSLKLKRRVILSHFQEQVESLYPVAETV